MTNFKSSITDYELRTTLHEFVLHLIKIQNPKSKTQNKNIVALVLLVGAVYYLVSGAICRAADDNATEPHLQFKKTVVVKPYRDGRAYAEKHTVKPGDHLWKILREHYRLENAAIAFYCTMARDINAGVADINDLKPNQNILVPYDYVRGAEPEQPAKHDAVAIVVKKGEYLAGILRERCCTPEEQLFQRTTQQRLAQANPQIADINAIEPGQTLLIPADLCPCGSTTTARQHAQDRGGTLPTKKATQKDTAAEHFVSEHALAIEAIGGSSEMPDSVPADDEKKARSIISSFARSFGGSDNSTGQSVFSIGGRGQLILDRSTFPVYEFPWGKKVVFDYNKRLSDGLQEVIAGTWNNAEIVTVNRRDDMEAILGKVLDASGFHRVERQGSYTVNKNNIQISISGNWIVFKDAVLRNVFIVSLVEDGAGALPESLGNYFKREGLNLVDIHTGAAASSAHPEYTTATRPSLQMTDPIALSDTILRLLGITFSKDAKMEISSDASQGFSLEVIADRKFEKDYETYVIDFHNLPRRIAEIFQEQGIKVLQIDPKASDKDALVQSILAFCNARYQGSPAMFAYDRQAASRVTITVPGYLLETSRGDVLITGAVLQDDVKRFLADIDVSVVSY